MEPLYCPFYMSWRGGESEMCENVKESVYVWVWWHYLKLCKLLVGHRCFGNWMWPLHCGFGGKKIGLERKASEIPPHSITIGKLISITSERMISQHGERRNAIQSWPDYLAFTLLLLPVASPPHFQKWIDLLTPVSTAESLPILSSKAQNSSLQNVPHATLFTHNHIPSPTSSSSSTSNAIVTKEKIPPTSLVLLSFWPPTLSNSFLITCLWNHQSRLFVITLKAWVLFILTTVLSSLR